MAFHHPTPGSSATGGRRTAPEYGRLHRDGQILKDSPDREIRVNKAGDVGPTQLGDSITRHLRILYLKVSSASVI
jgi:hypothetical protein